VPIRLARSPGLQGVRRSEGRLAKLVEGDIDAVEGANSDVAGFCLQAALIIGSWFIHRTADPTLSHCRLHLIQQIQQHNTDGRAREHTLQ
jgi:hypothetical protein